MNEPIYCTIVEVRAGWHVLNERGDIIATYYRYEHTWSEVCAIVAAFVNYWPEGLKCSP